MNRRQVRSRYGRTTTCKRDGKMQRHGDMQYVMNVSITTEDVDFAANVESAYNIACARQAQINYTYLDYETRQHIMQFIIPDHVTGIRLEREIWCVVPRAGVLVFRSVTPPS